MKGRYQYTAVPTRAREKDSIIPSFDAQGQACRADPRDHVRHLSPFLFTNKIDKKTDYDKVSLSHIKQKGAITMKEQDPLIKMINDLRVYDEKENAPRKTGDLPHNNWLRRSSPAFTAKNTPTFAP